MFAKALLFALANITRKRAPEKKMLSRKRAPVSYPRSTLLLTLIGLILCISSVNAATQQQPLSVDRAFQFSAAIRDNQTILARWKIAPGYYLYRARFHFKVIKPKNTELGQPLLPEGIVKSTPGTGRYQVYKKKVIVPVPIIKSHGNTITLSANYQGCSAKGYCYPPTSKIITVNLSGPTMRYKPGQPIDIAPNTLPNTQENHAENLLTRSSLLMLILGFLGFGVLISLTPCVLPMIPILSSIIVGQKNITHARSFALSLFYVLGMAATYAIAGVVFGFIGGSVQAILQKPWIIVLFSFIFVAMALSLFGLYNIELPQKLRGTVADASKHQKHTYFGVAVMGCLSTLILSPCVTAPLVGVLGYISQTGNATLGGIALFFMGIGMGAPLLVIGATGAKILPKTGAWMNAVKNILGIMMLGVAVYMLQRIVPGPYGLILWAALAIGVAIYAGAFSTSKTKTQLVCKCIGLLLFVYGILLVIGATQGNRDPLTPLQFQRTSTTHSLQFKSVTTIAAVKKILSDNASTGKIIMLDYYADWCIACKEMDHFTFSNKIVKQRLKSAVLLRADVTANNQQDKQLLRYFNVVAPPTILFFKSGKEIPNSRIIGEVNAQEFIKHLNTLAR